MRKAFKALLVLFGVVVVLFVLVIGINRYNTKKYAIAGPDYTNPQTVLEQGDVSLIEGQYLRGFHFPPARQTHPGTVVVFGGSDGGPNYYTARSLQDQGYNVLALYFFGQPGQQEKLSHVPLDFFDEVLSWIENNADLTEPVTLIGASKGAELVENLAAHYAEVDNFIAFTPSEYTYQGLDLGREQKSSFTFRQQPLPFLAFTSDSTSNLTMMTRLALGLPVSFGLVMSKPWRQQPQMNSMQPALISVIFRETACYLLAIKMPCGKVRSLHKTSLLRTLTLKQSFIQKQVMCFRRYC